MLPLSRSCACSSLLFVEFVVSGVSGSNMMIVRLTLTQVEWLSCPRGCLTS